MRYRIAENQAITQNMLWKMPRQARSRSFSHKARPFWTEAVSKRKVTGNSGDN